MAKIPLIIDKNYCSGWTVWHGIRELVQNAKDADEYDEHPMTINHFPKSNRLEIVNANVQVDPAHLLILGKTGKGDGRYRGKFGEGFVLGVLALVRGGCDVKFRNAELSWTVSFEAPDDDHPLAGNQMLTFHSRQLQIRESDFKVEVHNISTESWNAVKKLILFLDPPKTVDVVKVSAGALLLAPDFKGKVYVRGLYVKTFPDLECGYDLDRVELDRDRQMIDEGNLYYQLGSLWSQACAAHPSLLSPRIYELAKASSAETRGLKYHADEKLLASVRAQYEEEHGVGVPVATNSEAKEVTAFGGKPVMVSSVLKELLANGGLSAETMKAKYEGTIEKRWTPSDFGADGSALMQACRLEEILPNTVIVSFAGEKPSCQLIDHKSTVGVDRRMLDRPFSELLTAALTAEAQRTSMTPLDVLVEYVARVTGATAEETPAAETPPNDGDSFYHSEDVAKAE